MASDELVTTLKAARDSSKTSQEDSFSIADTGNPAMDINTTEPNATSDSFSSSREFTLFPKLPTEMQLLVWKQAIADIEPRIVEVTFEVDFDINTEIAHSPSTTPSLLHTCKNARGEAKKKYNELCVFAEKFTGAVIDYEKDTLFFNTGYATNGILRKAEQALWMRKCRQLALAEQFIFSLQPTRSQPSEFLTKFESLETLSMVSCDWPHNEDGHSVVAGTGNVHFAKHCRHGGQGIWRARILTLVIYHNPNIKNGGPVVTASRVAADSNNLESNSDDPNLLGPTCATCARIGNDKHHIFSPLTLPKNINHHQYLGVLDPKETLVADIFCDAVLTNERAVMLNSISQLIV